MITVSDLPVELLAKIMQCLHHYRDRPTLLSAALVGRDWSVLSQRILFSAVTDNWDQSARKAHVMSTHMLFLQTIAEFPSRLGPLVHSYAQDRLACDPAAATDLPNSLSFASSVNLWRLTANALPAMVNLKHLYLSPDTDQYPAQDGWASSRTLLSSLTFQLKTLTWGSFFHPHNGMLEFLAAQRELIHFEIWHPPDFPSLSWLKDDICTKLISVACDHNSFSHLAKTRRIIAWKCYLPYHTETATLAAYSPPLLRSLRYLSLVSYKHFHDIFGPIDLKIILLEISLGRLESDPIPRLSSLPSLRVLVLIQEWYKSDTNPHLTLPQSTVWRTFERVPSLEYIIRRFWHSLRKEYCYIKLWLSPDATKTILQEELQIHPNLAVPWWTIYNV